MSIDARLNIRDARRRLLWIWLLVCLVAIPAVWAAPDNHSYFPPLTRPTSLIVAQYWNGGSRIALGPNSTADDRDIVMLGSLAGVLLRQGHSEGIYLEPDSNRRAVLQTLVARRGLTYQYFASPKTAWDIVNRFKARFGNRYVLCDIDASADSLCVARMASWKYEAIIVDKTREAVAIQNGLTKAFDASTLNNQWTMDNWWPTWPQRSIAVEQVGNGALYGNSYRCLNDYTAATGAACMFEYDNTPLRYAMLAGMEDDSLLVGWSFDELHAVRRASINNVMLSATNWSYNLALMTSLRDPARLPLHQKVRQTLPTAAQPGTHYVTLIWSDGDNPQWAYEGGMLLGTQWWASPQRGQVHIGWSLAPALRDLCQPIVERFYEEARTGSAGSDQFVFYSSIGYSYPAYFSPESRALNAQRLAGHMRDLDVRIWHVLDDGGFDLPENYRPYLEEDQIDAIFYGDVWGDYNKYRGAIRFVAGKPIISSRINLSNVTDTQNYSPADAAALINSLPRDPWRPESYSLVRLAAWTATVADAASFAAALDPNVKIVPPETFAQLVRDNIWPRPASPRETSVAFELGHWRRANYAVSAGFTVQTSTTQQMVDSTASARMQTAVTNTNARMDFAAMDLRGAETFDFDIYCDGSNGKVRLALYNRTVTPNPFVYFDLTMHTTGWRRYSLKLDGSDGLKSFNGTHADALGAVTRFLVSGPWSNTEQATFFIDNVRVSVAAQTGVASWTVYE